MSYNRDGDIFKLVKAGVPREQIASFYKLSTERIRQITIEQYSKQRKSNPDIRQIDIVCRILGYSEKYRGRLQSILHKNGYTSYDDKWLDLLSDDILAIPCLGPESMCIIWLAQNMDDKFN